MLSLALKRGVASKALAKVKASYKLGEVRGRVASGGAQAVCF